MCLTQNWFLNTLVFRILTFVVYSVRKICARRPFTGRGTLYTIQQFLRQMHLILLAYSQTNSCIWLTKEAILGQAATVATENTWSRAIKTVSSCFSSLAQINRVNHVFDRSTLTTIINKLVSCFVVLPSGPMQRTLTFSSSKRFRTLQSGLSVFPETDLTTF